MKPWNPTIGHLLMAVCLTQLLASATALAQPAGDAATPQPPLSAEVQAVLDRIERSEEGLRDLSAESEYTVLQLLKANADDPDEYQKYFGMIRFMRQPEPARFTIHFEKWNDGNVWFKDQQEWFVFDGIWLTHAAEQSRSVVREQIVAPGENVTDLFKLGRGPFPLPFGQRKADILDEFYVAVQPPGAGDLPDSDHLVCTPKPGSRSAERLDKIELFIAKSNMRDLSGLPIQIIAHNRQDATRDTIVFKKIKRNRGLKPKRDFKLPIDTTGWDVQVRALPVEPTVTQP